MFVLQWVVGGVTLSEYQISRTSNLGLTQNLFRQTCVFARFFSELGDDSHLMPFLRGTLLGLARIVELYFELNFWAHLMQRYQTSRFKRR